MAFSCLSGLQLTLSRFCAPVLRKALKTMRIGGAHLSSTGVMGFGAKISDGEIYEFSTLSDSLG